MINTLQQRWGLLTQTDQLFLQKLHQLETRILESSVRMKQVNIAVWYHPAVQDLVDTEFAKLQPFWDRQLMVTERLQRWDEFVKELYRHRLHEWEEMDKEQGFSTDIADTRQAYAERMLKRLHDADRKVKMCVSLFRGFEKKGEGGGWHG